MGISKRRVEVRNTTIRKGDDVIHIETDGCIVNIRPGLYRDVLKEGETPRYEKVTAIEVLPDGREQNDPEHTWVILGANETICHYASVRVAKVKGDGKKPT